MPTVGGVIPAAARTLIAEIPSSADWPTYQEMPAIATTVTAITMIV